MTAATADFDARIRLFVYRHFVDRGRAPARAEVARRAGASHDAVTAAFERLAAGKALARPLTRSPPCLAG